MGQANNALKVYMNRPDRIRSVLEYYLGEKLPIDWKCEETGATVSVRNFRGRLSFRERDYLGKVWAWGLCFTLGLENQNSINLTYPWRLMEMDCLAYERQIEDIQEKNADAGEEYGAEDEETDRGLSSPSDSDAVHTGGRKKTGNFLVGFPEVQ